MNDSRLRLLRVRDETAFRGFVEEHQLRVIRLAASFVHNREDAEDIAQAVFVEAYHALPSFLGTLTDTAFVRDRRFMDPKGY
ncbi:MAG: RNA polymerase sigma factor [Candidatus Kapaibacterium sp.]